MSEHKLVLKSKCRFNLRCDRIRFIRGQRNSLYRIELVKQWNRSRVKDIKRRLSVIIREFKVCWFKRTKVLQKRCMLGWTPFTIGANPSLLCSVNFLLTTVCHNAQ